jgi:hypothetical protein
MRGKKLFMVIVAALMLALPLAAQADFVFQTINGTPPIEPGPFYWAGGNNLGWYYTPATDVDLTGIQTKLRNVEFNINNNFTVTTAVYTERPLLGGALLDQFSWNGLDFVDGPWQGGSFASPLHLTGDTQYFLGFTGWAAVLVPGFGGGGVMMAAQNLAGDPFPGEEFLDGWFGATDWDTNFAANSWPDGAILRFIATSPVPLPGTLSLVFSGLGALVALRRRLI